MNELGRYKESNGLTDEEVAKRLTDALGRKISAKGVAQQLRRESPSVPWLNALGIGPQEPGNLKNSPTDVKPPQSSPQKPGAEIALPFEMVSAKATIEIIYTMAGKGAAMASRTPDVARAWESAAPGLAEAWIEWAKENRTVANAIAMLTVGGPGGQVILMNASLLISTLMTIQNAKGLDIIPPHLRPPMDTNDQTEAYVDEQLRATEPPS